VQSLDDIILGAVHHFGAFVTKLLRRGLVVKFLGLYTEPQPPLPRWRLPMKPTMRQLSYGVWLLSLAEFATGLWYLLSGLM
jgi:hypothetical protein